MSRFRSERGSAAVEAVAGAAVFAAFCGVAYFGGQIALAHQTVQLAAAEAARSASIARTPGSAAGAATAAAAHVLANHQLSCLASSVTVDTSGFAVPLGQPAWVSATVTCQVAGRDLGIPVALGSVTVEQTMRSPLDTYRPRT